MDARLSDRMPWSFVVSLSVAQLVSWGTVFYAFALFLTPMSQDLGWSKPQLTAAYSLGLAASALGAVPVGRLIDKGHGRSVMTGGSLLAAALLALWSWVESYPVFVVLWMGLGLAMSAVLYDPGFAVLARRLGPLARRGIVVMTLLGGLASTVFIPLTHGLIEALDWRPALLALAFINLVFGAAVHWLAIPPSIPASRREEDTKTSRPPPAASPLGARRALRSLSFWGFVGCAVCQGIIAIGLPIHFIPLLLERGFTLNAAVAAFAVIGPAQVIARFMAFTDRGPSIWAFGFLTLALGVCAFGLLLALPAGSWLVMVFAGLYGASNGMMTILRAMLPAELFGREDYGAILGMIAMPANLTKAAGPFAFGALWGLWGSYDVVIFAFLALSVAAFGAFCVTALAGRPTTGGQGPEKRL